MKEVDSSADGSNQSSRSISLCPYKFAQRVADMLGVNNFVKKGTSPRCSSAGSVMEFLLRWKSQVDHDVFTTAEMQGLIGELENYQIPFAQYKNLSEKYPTQLIKAKWYAAHELGSIKEFIKVQPNNSQTVYRNICLSFHEILAVLEIIHLDLDISLDEAVKIAKKILLNNATLHNSIGGGLLHLYLKFHSLGNRVFTLKDGKIQHTTEFISFTSTHLADYLHDLTGLLADESNTDVVGYQLSLLNLESVNPRQESSQVDIEGKRHFLINYFYDRIKFMCPFLRSKGLEGFIDGIFQPFIGLGRP